MDQRPMLPRKTYYECHVTILGSAEQVRPWVESMGWTFSAIDGDPDLGAGVKCYATKHYNAERNTKAHVVMELSNAANALRKCGADVIREKVELVVHDVRA